MFKKKLLIPLTTLALLITACGGNGGGNKSTSKPADASTSGNAGASTSGNQNTSTSQAPAHEHTYQTVGSVVKNADDKDVFLKQCSAQDDKYIGIAFKDYSGTDLGFVADLSNYSNVPQDVRNEAMMMEKKCTVSWKINVDKAITGAKLEFAAVSTNSDQDERTLSDRYSTKVNDGELLAWDVGTMTYGQAGLNQTAFKYIVSQTIDLVAGENTISLYQGNGGYRLLFGGEVRIHYTGDAKPVAAPIPFDGYAVTFVPTNCRVFVYSTKQYATEVPVETNSCVAKDEDGNVVPYDIEDELPQPQVSFKVVCDDEYVVGISDITVEGTYKNFKQGPNVSDGLPDANHFRITKVQTDLKITIVAKKGELKNPEATFVTNHCSVVVYKSQTISDENIDTEEKHLARDGTSGDPVLTGGQINFKVVPEAGYKWNHGLSGEVAIENVPFIYRASKDSGKNFKVLEDNCYRITKVNDDVAIYVNCIPEAGEAGLGYEITFATEHCSVLVYESQDYRFAPAAPVDNKVLSRTENGSAAKYVAKVDGVDANGDGDYDDDGDVAPVAEVKPQVNFKVVCDEGYEFASGIEVGAEASGVSFVSGNYNKVKNMDNGIYRVTKIKGDLTITISATLIAA